MNRPKNPTFTVSRKRGELLSVDGIWMRAGKNLPRTASTSYMNYLRSHLDRDVFLTAMVVIPASVAWIFFDQLWIGVGIGILIYGAVEYGIPSFKSGRLNTEIITRYYTRIRESIRSRTVRA